MKLATLALTSILALQISCSGSADFVGGGNGQSTADPAAVEEPAPLPEEVASAGTVSTCDLDADFVAIEFPANIQTCVDSGNIYNFYTDSCSPVKKSENFECTFEGVKNAMIGLEMDPAPVDQAVEGKAKLIGCGEKREGKSIITQWWYPTTDNLDEATCAFTSEMVITTGCFQRDDGDGTVTSADTPEGRSEIIKKCLE